MTVSHSREVGTAKIFVFLSPCTKRVYPVNQITHREYSWLLLSHGLLWTNQKPPQPLFPIFRGMLTVYLNIAIIQKSLSAEPWLQGKSATMALWLETGPASKHNYMLASLLFLPLHAKQQSGQAASPLRFCWGGLCLSPALWKCPCTILLRVPAWAWAKQGLPCAWLSALIGTWEKAKQFYVGSAATGKLLSGLSCAPGVMSHWLEKVISQKEMWG